MKKKKSYSYRRVPIYLTVLMRIQEIKNIIPYYILYNHDINRQIVITLISFILL